MLLGIGAAVVGYLGLLPESLNAQNGTLSANVIALWVGAALFLFGILGVALARDRYAVRIATAEGEKNAIVSNKREYIAQIVDALNRAFNFETTATPTTYVTDQTGTIR
jgi:hypothetical protein